MNRAGVASLIVLVAALVAAAPSSGRVDARIASYCSTSGDVCYGIFKDAGVIRFRLTTAAQYFSRYRICVRPPRGATSCKSFPVRPQGVNYGGSVIWQRNFPNRGAGVYRVRWRLGTQALGPALTFRRSP